MSQFNQLQILKPEYLPFYRDSQPLTIHKHIATLRKVEPSLDSFSYLVSSSIFSSRIEGNPISINDYYRHQEMGLRKTKPIREVEDLINAYKMAQKLNLNEKNLLRIHKILSHTILHNNPMYQGQYRDKPASVYNLQTGKVVYRAANETILKSEMERLFTDIAFLIDQDLTHNEIFYFAAQIHLRMAQIHPFADGNGRTARLMEKWFLSAMIGDVAWYIQSERNYQKRLTSYYKNIHLGSDYDQLNYGNALPFLLMLPWALRVKAER